jgi:hypothetical protein
MDSRRRTTWKNVLKQTYIYIYIYIYKEGFPVVNNRAADKLNVSHSVLSSAKCIRKVKLILKVTVETHQCVNISIFWRRVSVLLDHLQASIQR